MSTKSRRTANNDDVLEAAARPSGMSLAERRPIRRDTGFADEVFEVLRSDIIALRIPPDTRMSIDDLARQLGVSQTPIREALRQLEAMGLVTKRHYVGYCSAPTLTRQQFDELYEVRLQLEPYAARCAATRMDAAALVRMGALARAMRPEPPHHSYDVFAEQDAELHALVAAGSGNRIIQETLARLHLHFHILRLRFHSRVTTEAIEEHEKLIDALVNRDADSAERFMREHVERSYERLAPFTS